MDSHSSAFSRLSLEDLTLSQRTNESLTGDTEIFQIDRFIDETLDSGLLIFSEDDFERGEFLGSGTSMSVYKGEWKSQSRTVALKYINVTPSISASSAAARDIELQGRLKSAALELRVLQHEAIRTHPNVVDMVAVSWHQLITQTKGVAIYPILVMELACLEHPTLGDLIRTESGNLSLPTKLSLLRDVLEGISILHELMVVHGDIKPDNILIFRDTSGKLTAKISDFGFSQVDLTSGRTYSEAGGTEYWNAPECLKDAPEPLATLRKKNTRDIYSYALLAAFVLLGELPFAYGNWPLPDISKMKLTNEVGGLIAARWRFRPLESEREMNGWRDLKVSGPEILEQDSYIWEVLREDGWHAEENLPLSFLSLLPKLLSLEPSDRPNLTDIRNAFKTCMPDRVIKPNTIALENDISNRIVKKIGSISQDEAKSVYHNNPDIPHALRIPLFKSFLIAARDHNHAKRTKAMVDIGFCMINAFGTRSDISEAIVWFGRAGMEGSELGKGMVFRIERILKRSATELVIGLSKATRANWMVTCLLSDIYVSDLPNSLPPGIHSEQLQARLRNVLLGFEPALIENGLQRAVDDYIIRGRAFCNDSDPAPELNIFPDLLWDSIMSDDPTPIASLLDSKDPRWSKRARRALLCSVVEARAMNIMRSLVQNHEFFTDRDLEHGLARAFETSDTQMIKLLLDLGVPWTVVLSSNVMNTIITGCNEATIKLALAFAGMLKIEPEGSEIYEFFDPAVIRRETMDGIQPAISNHPSEDTMVDNFSPPIFDAIMYNRPLNLRYILSLGGNPNIRYMGMTALHLAVRMLRPSLVGILLAFGANPNARDFRYLCQTPLHQVSREKIFQLKDYFKFYDMFGDKFIPAPTYPDEDNHHRRLIIRLLLEYGADLDAFCIEGQTPLTTALLVDLPHAQVTAKYLIEMGADISKAGGALHFSAIHAASSQGGLQLLKHIIYVSDESVLNQQTTAGETPLMMACVDNGQAHRLIILLEAGADITSRDNSGRNALSIAMEKSNQRTFDILINHISQLPARLRDAVMVNSSVSGRTAVSDIFAAKDETMIPYFLQKLIPLIDDFHHPSKAGFTPLHRAVALNHLPATKIILENGANINARALEGMTALHLAYRLLAGDLIDLLCSWGADQEIKNSQGFIPRELGIIPDYPAEYFQEVTRIEQEGAYGHKTAEGVSVQVAQYEKQLREDSQYVPNDPFTREVSDSVKGVTKIEQMYLKMLEDSVSKNGVRHFTSLWRMSNLGCVYERYGRLAKAESIYRRGWRLSIEVLGNNHLLTADLANKLARVREDLVGPNSDKALAQWISKFKKDTLTPSLLHRPVVPDKEILPYISSDPKPQIKETCGRQKCSMLGQLICSDKNSFHRRQCIRSLTPEENPAIITQRLRWSDPYAQKLIDTIEFRLMEGFARSDFGEHLPVVHSAHMLYCDQTCFDTPIRLRVNNNTVIMFLSSDGFEYLAKGTSNRLRPRERYSSLFYEATDLWIFPDFKSASQNNSVTARGRDETAIHTEMLLIVGYTHMDGPKTEERRMTRLQSLNRRKNNRIEVIQCDHSGK
ncbi:hypothetical protein FQN57_004600 [Myotisia sp. PD_48]|nr:hypothetical protein FQN57_004600 [Myotisia sp. PD_48]